MAILSTENFESGSLGAAVTTSNTSFSNVSGIGATFVAGLAGTLAGQINNTNTTTFFRSSGFSGNKLVFRWLLRINSLPDATVLHAHTFQGDFATGTRIAELRITSTGTLQLRDFYTAVGTPTSALSVGVTYALEWMIDLPTDTQTLRVYADLGTTATPVTSTTGAVTTTTPANNGGVTTINQIQIGKMTAVNGWNHIVDHVQRADGWVASSAGATPALFVAGFNGTVGQDVLLADDSDFTEISVNAPTYVADGADTTQKCVDMSGDSTTLRSVSIHLSSLPPVSHERFYFKIHTPPAAGQEFIIWEATSLDKNTTTLELRCRPGVGGLYDLALYDTTYTEIDSITGVPASSWMRIEISMAVDADTNTQTTVSSFTGNNRHGLTPNQSVTMSLLNNNTRRRALKRGIRTAGTTNPAFRFDAWRCDVDGQQGPTSDPYIPPSAKQWRFSEWNGVEEDVLTPSTYGGGNPDPSVATLRIRNGQFQQFGVDFVPVGFVMMAVALPIGSEGGASTGPSEEAWATWQAEKIPFMAAMKNEWNVNTFRLQLGQNGIDPSGVNYSQAYVDRILSVVGELRDNGFNTILCMQDWDNVDGDQHKLPTVHTQRAWQKLLPYINAWSSVKRSGVAAEIFNEPWLVDARFLTVTPLASDWQQWRDGGHPAGTITQADNQNHVAVGHQQVLETIRAAGFTGVVLASGPEKGHTLSGLTPLTDTLANPNVGYSIHTQHFHVGGNTTAQNRTQIWEPRWSVPKSAFQIAVTATEWSTRRVSPDEEANLEAVVPTYLDWMMGQGIGIQPWAIDTGTTGNHAYVISKTGANAWDPTDYDTWDAVVNAPGSGTGELLFNRYPTWSYLIGALDMGATTIMGDTGGPEEPPPGESRFPGDPGKGKIYLGWDTEGQNWAEHFSELARWRAASTTGYPANPNIKEGVYRIFDQWGDEGFGNHTDNTWKENRQGAANCDVIFINYEIESGTSASTLMNQGASGATFASSWGTGTADRLTRYLNTSDYDPWIATLASKLKDIYARYGTYAWLEMSNEPDAWGNSKFPHVGVRMDMLRQAHRKFYFELVAAGVENFTVTSPTVFNQTGYQHQTRHGKPIGTTLGTDSTNRWDTIYQWHPDWKGTRTNWTSAWTPNPVDFYGANETDEWGYGTGPIIKLWGANSYCPNTYNYPWIFNMTYDTMVNSHIPTNSGHYGEFQRFFRALYGKQLPIVQGEYGYPIWQVGNETDPVKTAQFHEGKLLQSMLDNEWVAASVWIQVPNAQRGNNPMPHWLPIGGKYNYPMYLQGKGGASLNDQPEFVTGGNDSKRKGLAAMFSNAAVVTPGQGKPLSPQHG